jgi:cytochrome c553
MQAYKTGARKHDMMKSIAAGLSAGDVDNVALYFALIKPVKSPHPAKGDANAGKAAATSCFGCHGDNGVSGNANTPSLAGQDAEYLAAATKGYKDGTRSEESMKGIAGALDDKTMRDLGAYFAAQTPQAVAVRKPLSTAEWVDRCDRCHGVNGNSADPSVPALAAQRADWLETVLANYRSGARKSTAMSAMTSALSDADIREIAAYYSRQTARPVTYVIVPAK